ncbi:MAG: TIR domain-containing protein [Sphingomonadales bacterium]|jgi:TolB-like protein
MTDSTPLAPARVFVSYARPDEKAAQRMVAALEAAGHSVWWDGLIRAGEGYNARITAALEQAAVVVVLWSAASVASNWVRDEAQIGADRGRLVPVSLDGAQPPLGFRQFQTIAYDDGHPDAVRRIADAVGGMLGQADAPSPARPPARGLDRRRLLIGGGVAAAAVAAAAAAGLGTWFGASPAEAAASTVAVLPFETIGDPGQRWFADGVAAEIRSSLATETGLRVAAQTSSEMAAGQAGDARSVAGKLDVAWLLEGSVRRQGERVRVSAELIDGRTGFTTWSQSFDRAVSDVFAVQDEIAGAVVGALTDRIARPGKAAMRRFGTDNLAAYDAYLRGRNLFDQSAGEASDRAALAAFDDAVARDPDYAAAHAARARALAVIANRYGDGSDRKATYDAAITAARRAVMLAPNDAAAQSALGFTLYYGRLDLPGAKEAFERSAVLGADNADVLSRYALFASRIGKFAAARQALDTARRLDPLNARLDWMRGEIEIDARRYPEAIAAAQSALARNPKINSAHAVIGTARLLLGDPGGALQAYEAEPSSLFALTGQAIALRKLGRNDAAKAIFDDLIAEHGDNSLYQQAQIKAQWGEIAPALALLRQARAAGDAGLSRLMTDPLLDPLRREPGFVALQRELGLAKP